jgi:Uma2 family endonuclease
MAALPALDRRITPEELLELEDGTKYELIDGVPVERLVSTDSSRTTIRFVLQLGAFVLSRGLGEFYDSELQVRAFPWEPSLVRKPDAAFVTASRSPARDTGYLEIAPDWVLETISLNDGARETREKVDLWLRAGVRMVWVAYPEAREIYVYRTGARPEVFTAEDRITGEDVIAGFSAAVADLFPEPAAEPIQSA